MAYQRNFVIELFWKWHPRLYRWSGGRLGGKMAGLPVLLIETVGRRSGARRETALTYLPHPTPTGAASGQAVSSEISNRCPSGSRKKARVSPTRTWGAARNSAPRLRSSS